MIDHNLLDIEEALMAANSLRGAVFTLKNHVPEFMGYNIGYEYFVREHSYMRGDVIVQTTLPHDVTQQYAPSGGQNADPIIENIAQLKDRYTVDLTTIIAGKQSKYKNKFFTALSNIGVKTMTAYAFLPPDSHGFGALTILEEVPNASHTYPPERFAEIGFQFHTLMKRQGQLKRYLGINAKEQAVLERMADGKTAQDAAQEFGVTPRTIEMRLQSARQKLKARTTTEAVFKSVCYGIL
ncbi:MAG: helix-turn-helix transcriptional regulator [Hellea sp.]